MRPIEPIAEHGEPIRTRAAVAGWIRACAAAAHRTIAPVPDLPLPSRICHSRVVAPPHVAASARSAAPAPRHQSPPPRGPRKGGEGLDPRPHSCVAYEVVESKERSRRMRTAAKGCPCQALPRATVEKTPAHRAPGHSQVRTRRYGEDPLCSRGLQASKGLHK